MSGDKGTVRDCLEDWRYWAHAGQSPPDGDWRTWLFMGGRGAGKTRAGAEWVRRRVLYDGCGRVALVAPTLLDAREVMIEGVSGLAHLGRVSQRPVYQSSRRRLEWPNGAVAQVFSAEDPDSLRGPQFDTAWCDEIGAWSRADQAWDMLMFGLRLGDRPQAAATTTPRSTALIKRLLDQADTVSTHADTNSNTANLSAGFVDAMQARYGGLTIGRQELDGELVRDPERALWRREGIESLRCEPVFYAYVRIILAIDPPAGKGAKADACGIIVAARTSLGDCHILADGSVQGERPIDWASRAAALARKYSAAEIIAEANQGGEMVREVLELAGATTPIRLVNARFGKAVRAAPVAALYEQNRVCHAGRFPALEDEMCAFGTDEATGSPDRVDALVWAVSSLMLHQIADPRIRRL